MRAKIPSNHPFYEIIQDAYRVFDYPTPLGTGVCESCCMDDKIVADFFNPPIAELPWDYLRDWFSAAYDSENFQKNIWAYLLPRILEALAAKDVPDLGLELALDRYQTGNPENWTSVEWDILDRFQKMFLARTLVSKDQGLDETLCMFYRAGWSLDEMFAQIHEFPDHVILECLDWNWESRGIPINPFWQYGSDKAVLAYYTSALLRDRITNLMTNEDASADRVNKAARVVRLMHANAGRRLRF